MNSTITINNNKTQFETIQVDLKSTPYTLDETASKSSAYLMILFGLFWSALPLLILLQALATAKLNFELLCVVGLFLTLGAIIVGYGYHLLTSERILTFHKDVVVIYTNTIWKGKNKKTLPYSAFKGVLMDEYIQHRKNQSDLTFQTIKLVHENKSFTIELFKKLGSTPPRALWKEYVAFMRVPALQKDGDSLLEVHHDDLDLSLQQRAKRQYAKSSDFSAQDVPEGFEIEHEKNSDGDYIHIRIVTNRMSAQILALFGSIPFIFMVLPFFTAEISFIFSAVGTLFLLVLGGMALQDHRNKREITITRSEISIEDIQPQNTHEKTVSKLSLSDIENILIKGEPFNEHLVIIGKEGEMSTNTGLSKQTLKWLQSYLRAAVVTA